MQAVIENTNHSGVSPTLTENSNEPRIVELPHRICHSPPDNPEITMEMVKDLYASMSKHGQLVEAIACPHLELPGEALIPDGNGRLYCCRLLDMPLRARWLDHVPSEDELITIRVTTATIKKSMNKAAIAADIYRWKLLKDASLAQVADHFGYETSGAITKLTKPFSNGIEELIKALQERRIVPASAYLVACMPQDIQREVLPMVLGKKRLAVESILAPYKEKKSKGPKPQTFKCGTASITLTSSDAIVDCMKTLLAKMNDAIRNVEKRPVPDALKAEMLREFLKTP
ncbi:hypothetical protein BH10PLA2_BH10PLA2_26500 [soil metagenome]